MGILSLVFQIWMFPVNLDQSEALSTDIPVVITQAGTGSPCKIGDIATVDYQIEDETGKEIANSERRGISSTLEVGGTNSDPLLGAAALGAKEGEERYVILFVEDWYPQVGPGSLVGSTGTVLVRLKVTHLQRR